MNPTLLKKSFIARAKTLAHVMTRSTNVAVTVSGNQAFNSGGAINIPSGDFNDPEWVKMVQGWIDHELGHEKHTDMTFFKSYARKGKLHMDLLNVIEDVRMEKAVGNEFPGARQNLATLAELAVKRNLFADPTNCTHPLTAVFSLLLYRGRAMVIGQTCLRGFANTALLEVSKHFGAEFAQKLSTICDRIEKTHSTRDAAVLVDEVIELLKQEKQNQEQKKSDDSQSGDSNDDEDAQSDENQPGDSNDDAEADSDGNQSGSDDDAEADSDGSQSGSDDDAEADSDGSQSGSDDDAEADSDDSQPGDSTDSGQGKDSPSPTPEQILEAIEKAMNDADSADTQDFHKKLAEMLGEDAKEAQEDVEVCEQLAMTSTNAIRAPKDVYANNSSLLEDALAKRISGGVYQSMHKVLFDQVQSLETTRKVGNRIVNRKLSGVAAGNLSVFTRRAETQDVNAAVSVVIDASGSMLYNDRMKNANTCAFALALALNKCGVASEFVYFGKAVDGISAVHVAKSFEEKPLASRFCITSSGGTPTGSAMQFALRSLVLRTEGKKMMIVITDGEPDSVTPVVNAVTLANSFGVKVVPIGIETNVVGGFGADEFVCVDSSDKLGEAIKQAIRLKLF